MQFENDLQKQLVVTEPTITEHKVMSGDRAGKTRNHRKSIQSLP